jgi:hypothetical protein
MTMMASLLLAGAQLFLAAPRATHFDVTASYTPARGTTPGEVAVQFVGKDPDVKINEIPAPRLKLEAGPASLVPPARPVAAAKSVPPAAGTGSYLDLTLPVTFPVTVARGTPRGSHDAKGTVTYFYCSKREGWCRKGTAEVAFPIVLP